MSYNEVGGVFEDNQPEKVDISFSKVDDTFLDKFEKFLERAESRHERYELTWNGKSRAFAEAGRPLDPAKTLRPDLDESVDFDNTQNLFITGDNLEALKLLQESCLNKIDMIYIDPPYNTGHDFIYRDNFYVSLQAERDKSRDVSGERQYAVNSKESGRYHSDWLSMMYPRLMLARNLLSDQGVIFISIDDSEQSNLQELCNEVFDPINFIGIAPRKTRGSATTKGSAELQTLCDYVLIYARDKQSLVLNKKIVGRKSYPLHDERGDFYIVPLQDNGPHGTREARPNLWYPIYVKMDGSLSYSEPSNGYRQKILPQMHQNKEGRWMWSKSKFDQDSKDLYIKDGRVYIKHYHNPNEDQNKYQYEKLWLDDMQNAKGTKAVNDLFETRGMFSNPKPVELIEWCLRMATNKDSIILDFFAGSGTTAHAVMKLNAEDGGHRKFIMVQLDEKCDEKSEAYKVGYKTIDQLSRERIRRAAKQIKETDKNAADHDYGFRALYVDKSNVNDDVFATADVDRTQLQFQVNNIRNDRSPLDLLFGVLVAKGWQLDGKVEERQIGDNAVYLYDYLPGAGMVSCFDENLDSETVNQIIGMHPNVAVFRESSFNKSSDKLNLMERFKNDSPETSVWVI